MLLLYCVFTNSDLFFRNGICKQETSQVQCPTLIVHGAKDAMVPAEHPEYFKQHIPNARSDTYAYLLTKHVFI